MDRDLEDGDLCQARERLFYVVSSLLLDDRWIDRYGDGEEFQAATKRIRDERRPFRLPVAGLLRQYYEAQVASYRAALQVQWRRSGRRWDGAVERLVRQQEQELKRALFSSAKDDRVLAIRQLLRIIEDAAAVHELRQARGSIETYEQYLRQKRDRAKRVERQEQTQQLRQEIAQLRRQAATTIDRSVDLASQLAQEQQQSKDAIKRARDRANQLATAREELDRLRQSDGNKDSQLDQLAEDNERLEAELQRLKAVPAWQQQVDTELAANTYFAEKLQEIKKRKGITKPIKDELLDKTQQLWDQAHFEMMQESEEGESCEHFEDNQEPLLDGLHSLPMESGESHEQQSE